MSVLGIGVDRTDSSFAANAVAMRALVDDLHEKALAAARGGGEEARRRRRQARVPGARSGKRDA